MANWCHRAMSLYLSAALGLVAHRDCLPEMAAAARYTMMPRNWGNVIERFEVVACEALL